MARATAAKKAKKTAVKVKSDSKAKKTKKKTTRTKKPDLPAQIVELVRRAEEQQREERGKKKGAKKSEQAKRTRKVAARHESVPDAGTVRAVQAAGRGSTYEVAARYTVEFKPFVREKDGQLTLDELRKLSHMARKELWKKLNDDPTQFFGIVKPSEIRNSKMIRKAEAIARGIITEKRPHKDAMYCPYCADWNIFRKFAHLDSTRCIGCGISTSDFYTRSDNHLWSSKK